VAVRVAAIRSSGTTSRRPCCGSSRMSARETSSEGNNPFTAGTKSARSRRCADHEIDGPRTASALEHMPRCGVRRNRTIECRYNRLNERVAQQAMEGCRHPQIDGRVRLKGRTAPTHVAVLRRLQQFSGTPLLHRRRQAVERRELLHGFEFRKR